MTKRNQNGSAGSLVLFFLMFLVLIGAIGFGAWAYNGRQSYKNNVDTRIATAVAAAKQQQSAADDATFATEEKSPLESFTGPEAYGSVVLYYPKTWSGYVDDTGNGAALVDGYFSPGVVPSINAATSVFALRVQVQNQAYSSEVQQITSQVQGGSLTAEPYALPKVPSVVGLKAVGHLPDGNIGTEVVLPVRNQTIVIWTDGAQYLSDFNTYILPNFSFSP